MALNSELELSASSIDRRHIRLGILVSHPIQYFSPWFRELAKILDLRVFYIHRQSKGDQSRAGFGVDFQWDTPLLEGYEHAWLENAARSPGVDRFFGCNVPDIEAAVRRERLDALLVFGWRHLSSWQALRACRKLGVPVLMKGDSGRHSPRGLLKRLSKRIPYRLLLPRFDAHLYVGNENRKYLEHYGVRADRLFFSPLTVDQDRFSDAASRARRDGRVTRLRDRLGIGRQSFVFLFVGKFTQIKRPDDFLRGFLELHENIGHVECDAVLVGDGPMRAEIEHIRERLPDRIHLVGFQNQSDLPTYYAMADALVVPGDETWGLVVNEAAACGTPAIVSDGVGCATDLVQSGETGTVFTKGDIDDLARRMLEMHRDIMNDSERIARGLAVKCAEYSLEASTTGLLAALEATSDSKDKLLGSLIATVEKPSPESSQVTIENATDGNSSA